ncbi:MAG: hypothetical protein WAM76_22680, partial [Pseudolabrys sp.]
ANFRSERFNKLRSNCKTFPAFVNGFFVAHERSAFTPKAGIRPYSADVRFVPIATLWHRFELQRAVDEGC